MTRRQSIPDATGDLQVERVVSVNGVPWVGNDGVSGISLSEELSVDERNGEVAVVGGNRLMDCDGGIVGETVGISAVSIWVVGGITEGVVSGIVVGMVPNKITHPVDVPTLSSDESNETEITEIAMTCTSKSLYKYHLYQPCVMRENNDQMDK
ncbi:hypothetical protein Tco_1201089 [Tanacetum coccineum]